MPRHNLACHELKAGMVVCEQNSDGSILEGAYNHCEVVSVEAGIVWFARPFVTKISHGNLSVFRRNNLKAEILARTDKWLIMGAIQTWNVRIDEDTNLYACVHEGV